jgi:hypothetical protein
MKWISSSAPVLGLAACLAFGLAVPASAEIEVTESTVPAIKAGATLPDDTQFNVPDGATVSVMKKPENAQFVIKGPFQGTLAAYLKKDRSWWGRMTGKDGEGSKQGAPTGATRSIRPMPKPAEDKQ